MKQFELVASNNMQLTDNNSKHPTLTKQPQHTIPVAKTLKYGWQTSMV